jgi:hypothetical protein
MVERSKDRLAFVVQGLRGHVHARSRVQYVQECLSIPVFCELLREMEASSGLHNAANVCVQPLLCKALVVKPTAALDFQRSDSSVSAATHAGPISEAATSVQDRLQGFFYVSLVSLL